ncbi:MAG: cytochrome c oxidase assembly protein [Methylobacter sp.]
MLVLTALPVDFAQAHGLVEGTGAAQLPEILGGLLFILLWLSYCIGARRIPPKAGRSLVFHGASLIAALIIFAPLEDWTPNGSAMHMIQHMLIMAVIAPLYVLARPLPQWLAASGRLGVSLSKPLLRLGRYPLWTSGLQGVAIWFWHAPRFYNLALASPWWHLAEHASFALTAGVFWWSILCRRTSAALPVLLFTLMHTGMLGALLTFAQTPLFGDLLDLQDQQLAGLIMWVPGGLSYLIAGVWCSLHWLRKNRLVLT